MNKLYATMVALFLVAALPVATLAAMEQSAAPQATEKAAQQNMEDVKKTTMEKLEIQEDKQSTTAYIDDAGITAKVKAKFLTEKGLDSLEIKVVTVDGTVTLIGDVDTTEQIALAEKTAMAVEGVRKVDNKLVLKK